jgi:aminoglycoside phosphotransferase (APT) family kinase protein
MDDPATQGTETPRGIDASRVTAWFHDHVAGVEPPLEFELVAGGRSNLTYIVTDRTRNRYVLRRPPTGHLLPTAHDMAREHRIISAMAPAGVPVPPAVGLCDDPDVTGAPFYVMGFVEGVIARTEADVAAALDQPARKRASLALVDTLAQIHRADPDAIGLGDLGRKDGYIARQLKRWLANYQAANQGRGAEPMPDMERIHDRLAAHIPEQGRAAVVHGDYRLDNCVVAPDGSRIEAVLDWELCTLGDPLADLGQLLVYWPEPGEFTALGQTATTMAGFASRDELVARYSEQTGRELPQLGLYVAFAYWKLACILEGVYSRYVGGAMGDDGFDPQIYPRSIAWLAERAVEVLDQAGVSRP